ncbi:MAG TPA: rhodanese-like domain-containing protein [Campylobacteraceae bacterium]|nr:rhodanese-like domain-containing protein [Campylobacteraceae bacterium]
MKHERETMPFPRHMLYAIVLLLSTFPALQAGTHPVNITEEIPWVDVVIEGKKIRIERIQDTDHKLTNNYTKTSRPTPPFDIQPFRPIPGIRTVTELDLLDFLQKDVAKNRGLLIDARLPKWYAHGTIPGALNIPFSILKGGAQNPYIPKIFTLFGAKKSGDKWNFARAEKLLIFDNGPWCQQAVVAMKALLRQGYPKSKILYYRGGMQFWQIVGLTTITPKEQL